MVKFKDRERELKELRNIIESKDFQLVILYGRRRVGKTELILQATKQKRRIYYLAVGQNNLKRFYNKCSTQYPEIDKLKEDYELIFEYLKDKANVIIIDEFQNMIQEDENILHLMQSIIDTTLKESGIKLFLVGSSVSMMTSKVLNYKSPLYGRRTGSIKLQPINFSSFIQFFPSLSLRELIEIYGFSDGVPYYINRINPPFWKWLSQEFTKTSSIFIDEVDFLMRYEFNRPGVYKSILEAIAFGCTTLNEIKMHIKAKRTDISPYLSNLIDVEMILREVPVLENITSRRGRYFLKDNFLKFWFRYIYPNLSAIEEGLFRIESIKQNYSQYLGPIFEDVVKDLIIHTQKLEFTTIGRWWWKEYEMDLVALNQLGNSITFIECKWQENVNAERIFHDLMEKKDYINWNLNDRKEHFIIFAKSFYKKVSEYDGKDCQCFDLDDIVQLLEGSPK